MAGGFQFVYGITGGNIFNKGRDMVDLIGKGVIDYADYSMQYSVGTIATCTSKAFDKKKNKEDSKECNTQIEKK